MKPRLRRAAQIVRAALVRLLQTTWWKPMVRVVLFACGLVMLALVGRATSPASASPAASSSSPSASAISTAPPPSSTQPPTPVATPSASPAPATAPSSASARATPETPVILNIASIDDLRRLPGIGPKRAEAVLALRAKIGRFHQVEDLLRVKGIGRATLKRLRPLVRLDPAPPGGGDPAAAR